MKIELHEIPEQSIEDFADQHDLVMEIRERREPVGSPIRYYAQFKKADVREGTCLLSSAYGNGATPGEAIAAYAKKISLRLIIVDAYGANRKEIQVPRL